jgi:dTDP-4-dehydrorhamnose reductase
VWHGTSSGETTWHAFAREIFRQLGLDPSRVEPTTTDAFPRPAPRPAYGVLGHEGWRMARLAPLPDWRESLAKALPSVVPSR